MQMRNRSSLLIAAAGSLLAAAAPADPQRWDIAGTVDIKAAAAEGKRPTFEIKAYSGGILNVSFSFYPVVLDLKGGKAARKSIPVLFGHDDSRPLGQADTVNIDASGVHLSGSFTGDDPDTQRVLSHAKGGFMWQASVGASVDRREFIDAGKKVTVNGQEFTGPLMVARKWTLVETSIVTIGADSKSSAKIAAKQGNQPMDAFREWLKAEGIEDFDALTPAVQKKLEAAFAKTKEPEETKEDVTKLVAAAIAEIQAEATRTAAVQKFLGGNADLLAKAATEKWSAEKAELEAMRAARPTAGSLIFTRSGGGQATPEVLTAALCQAGLLNGMDKAFKPEVLAAADQRYKGRVGLQQILLEAAWAGGYAGAHFDRSPGGLRDILKAAFSNLSLPGIFSNTANKFLLEGFTAVEQAWRGLAAIRTVTDFKEVTSYRLTGNFEFEEVGPDGELKHGEVDEESFTNRAKTYGKMFSITRTDIINDDLGALSVIPRRIGRGGGLKFNKVFWDEFLADHATFFPTDGSKGNYVSGATTTVGSAGLKKMLETFRRQVDPDGDPLALSPAFMLVPPELEAPAMELNRSNTVNTGGAATLNQVPNANIYAGRFPPIVSAYLSSALEWYMGCSPSDLAMIEACFLNGVQQPTIESAEADFNVLGVQMRGFFDFGVNKQDHRAMVKSKGQA